MTKNPLFVMEGGDGAESLPFLFEQQQVAEQKQTELFVDLLVCSSRQSFSQQFDSWTEQMFPQMSACPAFQLRLHFDHSLYIVGASFVFVDVLCGFFDFFERFFQTVVIEVLFGSLAQ